MSPPSIEILGYETTPLGTVCLRRRELLSSPGTLVTEITLDHELLMSSYHTASERELARRALERCRGSELTALVGGLGLGYTAREVLASDRVAEVEVVELLTPVVRWLDDGLMPLSTELRADARLSVARGDVFALLTAPPSRPRDLVLIDVDHSPDDRLETTSARFYTERGLRAAREHLTPGGVLAVWSYDESSPFADSLRNVFGSVEVEAVTFENDLIDRVETDWLFIARA